LFDKDKKRLFRILALADAQAVCGMAQKLQSEHAVTVVKEPNKTLTMVKLRETVESGLFYLGEVIVWEAVVELDGVRGMAVTMTDSADMALAMAVIDAAVNSGAFTDTETLLWLEAEHNERDMRENALHLQTMVNFSSLDAEIPT
jgi:alpha-D-ribose 1-methylphosphonate 5-triphosphate synthase subunit PhnG